MTVRLVFLGRLEDLAGSAEITVVADTLADAIAALEPTLAQAIDDRVRIAVNGALIADRFSVSLANGDEVAFLPPVSGG